MHEPVKEHLERYLSGTGHGGEVEKHLADCPECREDVRQVQEQNRLLRSLRAPEGLEARPGFYARVMEQIDAQRAKATFWSGFLEPAFAKRLVFASLTLVVLLGSVVAVVGDENGSGEASLVADHPEAVMAVPAAIPVSLSDNPDQERDAVLVNLTTYSEPVGGGIQ